MADPDPLANSIDDPLLLNRIDLVCEEFEQALRESSEIRLESYLPDWPVEERNHLIRFLLELEIDYRFRSDDRPDRAEYHGRFPELEGVVSRVFERAEAEQTAAANESATVQFQSPEEFLARARQAEDSKEAILPGTLLGSRYRIAAILGRGGMGEVYRADDLRLGEPVALKLLPADVRQHPHRLELLTNEVRLARKISHPNVCRVFDIGQAEQSHFLSMEYIDGEDLKSLIRRIGPLPTQKVIELTHQLCSGLAAAHDRGVVHRDLKPANVMVDGRGTARITDFGLARRADDEDSTSGHMGTPLYMAPEQFFSHETSPQSDIFSLGLVIHEMLRGQHPLRVTTRDELTRMLANPLPTVDTQASSADEVVLIDVIQWCLQKEPIDRPPSALSISARLPGGDPLAVALATGDTPSPQAIAAARNTNLPSTTATWTFLALACVGLACVVGLWTDLSSRLGLAEPPQVLANEARETLQELDVPGAFDDDAYGFGIDRDYLKYLARNDVRWDTLEETSPPAVYFWYRTSPTPLAPRIPDWTGESYLEVDLRRPSFDTPGMVRLLSNPSGRVREFEVLPRYSDLMRVSEREQAVNENWVEQVIQAADLAETVASMQETSPQTVPPGFANQRTAWIGEGVFDGPAEATARIEVAALEDRPVMLRMIGDWTDTGIQLPIQLAKPNSLRAYVLLFWLPILTVGGLWIAIRNLRHGRSDLRSAKRVAQVVFIAAFVVCLLKDRHVFAAVELDLIFADLAAAALISAFLWCSYVALEPDARRFWPRTMIGWSRLVNGNWRDPVVGTEVLVGVAAGTSVGALKLLNALLPLWLDSPTDSFAAIVNLQPLTGMRVAAGEFIAAAGFGVFYSFFTQLLFLLLLRLVLRTNRRAAIAYVVFMSVLVASQHHQFSLTLAFTAVEMALTVYMFIRCGLLAVVVMHFVRLLLKMPMTLDLTWWGADLGLGVVFVILGLAGLGVWLVLEARRKRIGPTSRTV